MSQRDESCRCSNRCAIDAQLNAAALRDGLERPRRARPKNRKSPQRRLTDTTCASGAARVLRQLRRLGCPRSHRPPLPDAIIHHPVRHRRCQLPHPPSPHQSLLSSPVSNLKCHVPTPPLFTPFLSLQAPRPQPPPNGNFPFFSHPFPQQPPSRPILSPCLALPSPIAFFPNNPSFNLPAFAGKTASHKSKPTPRSAYPT